ncbi:MAG: N-carbamoyl-D-amino-acid hydrolase [Alphaproteobacteria bacterium]|nr:N-carbamoyl-D-amino-acid hydrolase [Alphaproteobacteria bacterium]
MATNLTTNQATNASEDRVLTIAAAQLGPIARTDTRAKVVERLVDLIKEASARGAELVVFPELALTTFFPRWMIEDTDTLNAYYESEMPSPRTQRLFDVARDLGIGFYLGYAELTPDNRRFNTSILVGPDGNVVGKYRKIHLPGHDTHQPWRAFQHLEKRYFEPGNLGFKVWSLFNTRIGMCICNDRRWPETYRVMGLQGVELILLGYNTPIHNPPAPEHDRLSWHHNTLVMQSGAYQNACFVIGVAKAGIEEGVHQMGGTQIIAPTGETIAAASTESDELIIARCDLNLGLSYRQSVFDFEEHRRPDDYELIVAPNHGAFADTMLT